MSEGEKTSTTGCHAINEFFLLSFHDNTMQCYEWLCLACGVSILLTVLF